MTRRAITVLLLLLLVGSGVALAANTMPAAHRLAVTGFQEETDPPNAIDRSARALTTVGVDGVDLTHRGWAVNAPDHQALTQLQRAHADHLRAELLIANWDNAVNDFYEPLAHGLLAHPAAISRVTSALARMVAKQGWDGISVDLESLAPRDEAGLVDFVRALRARLPASKTISVCVTNYDHASYYPADGYDLRALGRNASRLILMAYDEHGPWEKTPGPLGALPWQKTGLSIVLRSVPAAKLDLGQAGYGYAWGPHGAYTVSDARARKLVAQAHAPAHWIPSAGEWKAVLADGSTIWWADARSYRLRVKLARTRHLHGLAVWSLGLSDPLS